MTQHIVRWIGFVLVMPATAVILSGCGGQSVTSVAGTVTMDGEPLGEAVISFMPENRDLPPAFASTDLEGKYALEEGADGVPEGIYTVRISTYQPAITDIEPPIPGVQEQVPAKYNVLTKLSADVSSGENVIDFPLDSKGQISQPQESF